MSRATCDRCSRPVTDGAHLCRPCTEQMSTLLDGLPALLEDLEVTRTKQAKTAPRNISVVRSTDRPIPFDEHAREAALAIRDAVVQAGQLVLDQWSGVCLHDSCGPIRSTRTTGPACSGIAPPRSSLLSLIGWLRGRPLQWIRHQAEAASLLDAIHDAARDGTRIIDSPSERFFVGRCSTRLEGPAPEQQPHPTCDHELYAGNEERWASCTSCGARYLVAELRGWVEATGMADQLSTASVLAAALTRIGDPVKATRIRQWASRGHLEARATQVEGRRPLYRVGDVVTLLAAESARGGSRRVG